MIKNGAGQHIGAQLLAANDGSQFAGAVTVYITGDDGDQAVGSVGGGACMHKGTGYHSYSPSQAETNYDHIAFTFVGAGALTVTVQVYTTTDAAILNAIAALPESVRAEMDANSVPLALAAGYCTASISDDVLTIRDLDGNVVITRTAVRDSSGNIVSLS